VMDLFAHANVAMSDTTAWSFTAFNASSPAWTKKAGPAMQDTAYSSSSATFTAVPVNNTATSDIVIVCATGITYTGVTIGGNAMTLVVGSTGLSIWKYTGTIFTTPNIVVTAGGAIPFTGITVGVLSNINPAQTDTAIKAVGFDPNPQVATSTLDIPVGGFGIVAYQQGAIGAITPNNITQDYSLSLAATATDTMLWSGYMTTSGVPSLDGAAYVGSILVSAAWGP